MYTMHNRSSRASATDMYLDECKTSTQLHIAYHSNKTISIQMCNYRAMANSSLPPIRHVALYLMEVDIRLGMPIYMTIQHIMTEYGM